MYSYFNCIYSTALEAELRDEKKNKKHDMFVWMEIEKKKKEGRGEGRKTQEDVFYP